MSDYDKTGFEPINSKLLNKVTGGAYIDQDSINPGQVFCDICQKGVTVVKGSDGQNHCPDCGTVIENYTVTRV